MQAYLDSRIEVKSFNDETGEFEGYASTYGNVDNGNDMVCKGAFDDTLAAGQLPALCLQHKMDNVIGEWLDMKSDAKGLWVKGKIWINKGIGDAERAWLMLKSKGPKGLSIGFIAKAAKKAANGVRMITKAALKEISVVTYPMNELAQVTSMKSEAWDELLIDKTDKTLALETKAALQELTDKINNELVKSALRRNINNLTATSSH